MRFASACLFAFVLAGDLRAEDWPRFRGPRGNGTSAEADLPLKWGPKDNIAWKVELPGLGASSPIVDGVRAFDLDGKLIWHEQVGRIISTFGSGSSPILLGDKLIVNATVELAGVVALDKHTGKRLWKARVDGDCWSTPAVVDLPGGKQ